jgi:hypothetical protein
MYKNQNFRLWSDLRGAHLAVSIVGIFFFIVWWIGWPVLFFIVRGRADQKDQGFKVFMGLGWASWCCILVGWILAILNMALVIHAALCIFYHASSGIFIGSPPNCPESVQYYVDLVAALQWTSWVSPILIIAGVAILIAHAVTGANWLKEGGGKD